MNHTLTITNSEGTEIVKCSIGEIDPLTATLTVITALQNTKGARAKRKDASVPRKAPEGTAQ